MDDTSENLITRGELMKFISIKSEETIKKWEDEGMPYTERGRIKRYNLLKVLNWLNKPEEEV